MKKFLTILAMAIAFTSCTNDEQPNGTKPETTNVAFMLDQPNTLTGKQIKRGNIPVWVNTLKITATSNVFPTYTVNENFTFDEQNGASFISMNDVSTGSTTFTVSTTTDSPQFYQLTNYTSNASSAQAKFDAALDNINNENPYAVYAGQTIANINQTGTNFVTIPVTTQNGRLLTVFQLKQNLQSLGLQARITATYPGGTALTAITKGNELVTFKWSDVKSLNNVEITYTVAISAINNQNTIFEMYTIKQKVVASTSMSCFYELDFDDYVLTRNDVRITLNWQEWKDAHCTTCK